MSINYWSNGFVLPIGCANLLNAVQLSLIVSLPLMQKRVAIVEIGGSHDECILSQVMGLKAEGAWVVFCGSKAIYEKNSLFAQYFDAFHEVVLPRTMLGDVRAMRNLNKWFVQENIAVVVCNTAQGGHIRNLSLSANRKIQFVGIIHTIKMLQGSFTQKLISTKIKRYFVLNDTLLQKVGKVPGLSIESFYPLNYPRFENQVQKPAGEFWIAVIGGVENRRKDLLGFVEMAKQTGDNVQFYFLGKSDAQKQEVIAFKTVLEENNLSKRVHLFDSFLSEQELDSYLSAVDGIFPLVHPNTPSADEYFSRQISGGINIAFSYKIPMMIHENYADWEDFQQGVVFYNLTNFTEQFLVFQHRHADLAEQLKLCHKFNSETQNQMFAKYVLN